MDSLKIWRIISKVFSKFVLARPSILHFRVGSLDVLAMLLHQEGINFSP
jgi:hypothetical protein